MTDLQEILAEARTKEPKNESIYMKASTIARNLGSRYNDELDDGVMAGSYIYETRNGLFVRYYWWSGDDKDSLPGFGVDIGYQGECVFDSGSKRAFVYKEGEWENDLNALYQQYQSRN